MGASRSIANTGYGSNCTPTPARLSVGQSRKSEASDRHGIPPFNKRRVGHPGLERVTQDGTKIRAQASKRSFLDRKHLQQCLDLAKSEEHTSELQSPMYLG